MAGLLVLEGIEGCGKSTQARLLGEWLTEARIPHVLTREPGGTAVGEEIRRALLHGGELPARTELLLMLAARSALVEQVVRPALAQGKLVIADRFELSTFAYQGYGRGLPMEEVRAANAVATGGLRPELTIVLDVSLDEAVARRVRTGAEPDRIERAGDEFHRTVARAYRLLSQPDQAVISVNAGAAPEQVQQLIRGLVRSRFPETFKHAPGL